MGRKQILLLGLGIVALTPSLAFAQCAGLFAGCTPKSAVVGSAPVGAWFENLTLAPDGAFYLTDYTNKRIMRYTDREGLTLFTATDHHPQGISADTDGTLFFTAQEKSAVDGGGTFYDANLIYRIRPNMKPEFLMWVDGANFLNGITRIAPGVLLMADSRGGTIWQINVKEKAARKLVTDPLLDAPNPKAPTPGANGVKFHQGFLYVSNTAAATILRMPWDGRGKPGKVEVFAERARTDDFGFSPKGTLYMTTHKDKLTRLKDGKVEDVAGTESKILGNTAIAWNDRGEGPYVIGDGGFYGNKAYGGPTPNEATIVKFEGLE